MRIPVLNDDCLEEELETFSVTISSQQDCTTISRNETEINIRDDDSMSIMSPGALICLCFYVHFTTRIFL